MMWTSGSRLDDDGERRNRRGRRRGRAAAALLLGMFTTVAVAWGLVFAPTPEDATRGIGATGMTAPYLGWYVVVREGLGRTEAEFFIWGTEQGGTIVPWNERPAEEVVPAWMDLDPGRVVPGLEVAPDSRALAFGRGFGFPRRALRGWIMQDDASPPVRTSGAIALRQVSSRFLPLVPIADGFAVNTALAGALWWVVLFLPGRIRGSMRRRGGRCPGCGYRRVGLDAARACPECGDSGH